MNYARMSILKSLMEDGDYHSAAQFIESIAWRYIYPVPCDTEMQSILNFITKTLSNLIPLIGKTGMADLQTGLSFYFSLLSDLCGKNCGRNDVLMSSDWSRIHVAVTSTLNGIDKILSAQSADPTLRKLNETAFHFHYNDTFKWFQAKMKRILKIFEQLTKPQTEDNPLSGWMKIINDAVIFQIAQTIGESVLHSGSIMDPEYNRMVDGLYFVAMKMFIRDTEPVRQTACAGSNGHGRDATDQLFEHFQWMAVHPPAQSALEYCVSLSKTRKAGHLGVREFALIADRFYYGVLSGARND